MSKRLDLTSRVRSGMTAERQSATARLSAADVAGTAAREASSVAGVDAGREPVQGSTGRFKVRIKELISNPYNPRTFYNPETIDGLAKSFGVEGQLEAIKVTRLPDYPDKWVIVDGERRVRAGKSRGDEEIDAEISSESLESKSLYLRAYRANKERDPQTVFDDAISWKKLLDNGIYRDYAELAADVGEAPSHVNKVILLTSLPQNFLNRLAEHSTQVGLGHAYNLKLIYDRADIRVAEHWLDEILDGKVTVRKLEQVAATDAPIKRASSSRAHYQSRIPFKLANGVELGELKLFRNGRTVLELQGIPADAQQVLADRMKVMIEKWSSEIATAASPEAAAGA